MYSSIKARALASEVEASVVNGIAAHLRVSAAQAHALRTIFLLDAAGESICVEVSGSAHHTPVGDEGEDEQFEDSDEGEVASVKQYTYLNDGVVAGVEAGLLKPAGEPFRRSKRSETLLRYVKLTPEGKELAQSFVTYEERQKASKPCLSGVSLLGQVREQVRTGKLTLKSRELHS